jgi:TonB family protein
MNAPPQVLHRRDREALLRFLRMILASLLLHGLLAASAGLVSRRSAASGFRENSILVTFREPPKSSAAAAALPAPSAAIPSPPAPAPPAPAEKKVLSSSEKASPPGGEKILPRDATKAEVKTGGKASGNTGLVTHAEQAAMDAALNQIRQSVAAGERGAEQAEWDAAMAAAEASLQVQNYRRQAGQQLSDAWVPPVGAPQLSVRVLVRVKADGSIASHEIIRRSGHAGLDASVERIFSKVKKLDPIPWAVAGETATLGYEFQAGAGGP